MVTENFKIVKQKNKIISLFLALSFTTSFLIFILFQKAMVKEWGFPKPLLYVDEIFVVVFFYLLVLLSFIVSKIDKLIFPFLKILAIFIIIGLISGLINGNSILVTILGIFDYVKNFVFIFVGYYFFNNKKLLITLYNILLFISLILVGVAIFQEIFFLIGFNPKTILVPFVITRFGLLRTPSLVGHPNLFGLYIFLFFVVRIFVKRKIDFINFFLLIGIFLSISRFIWISTLSIIIIFSWKKGKMQYKIFSFALLSGFLLFAIPYFISHTFSEMFTQDYFRGYALYKSFEIWNDNKLFGVGSGMYGGVISLMFNSPIYDKYGFSSHWFEFMEGFNSIDQFYPQLLVETGILGFLIFMAIFYLLFKMPKKVSAEVSDLFLKNFLAGLSLIPIGLIFYLFGSGLNMTAFLITYFLLLGISLGVAKNAHFTRK